MGRVLLPLVVCLAGALSLLSAAEGVLPLDRQPDPLEAPWKFGPLRIVPSFRLEEAGWDSNVYLAPEGEEQGDLRGRMAVGLRGQMLFGRRGSWTFEERPSYTVFARTSSQNYMSNGLNSRADLVLGRLSLASGFSWTTTRDRPSDEFDARARNAARSLFASAAWRTVSRTALSVSGERTRLSYSDDDDPTLEERLDHTEDRVAERFSWRLKSRTWLYTEHSSRRFDFDREPGRDSRVRSWRLGALIDVPGPLTGMVEVGPGRLTSADERWTGEQGVYGEGSLAARAGESWLLMAEGRKSLELSQFENNLFYRDWRAGLTVRRALGPRLAIEAGGVWQLLQWPGRDESLVDTTEGPVPFCSTVGLPCSELREDRILSRFVGVRYRMAGRSELTGRLEARHRESNMPGLDDDQILLTTGAGF